MGPQEPRDEGESVGRRGGQAEGLRELTGPTGSVMPGQERFQWSRGGGGPPAGIGVSEARLAACPSAPRSSALHHPAGFVLPTAWSHPGASALDAKPNLRAALGSLVSELLVVKTQPL